MSVTARRNSRIEGSNKMRDRMERLVILPFSVGCMSEASVAVGVPQPKKPRPFPNSSPAATRCKGEEECASEEGGKAVAAKSNTSAGLNKLMKGLKNLSQMFGEKEDELEEEEEEEGEIDMQIGGPTDVQHVTHIGWDGHAVTANPGVPNMIGWDLLSLSLHHYHPQ